jgi:hypothetical protein
MSDVTQLLEAVANGDPTLNAQNSLAVAYNAAGQYDRAVALLACP